MALDRRTPIVYNICDRLKTGAVLRRWEAVFGYRFSVFFFAGVCRFSI